MNIEVITSFNQHYYDMIGKDCVETWKQYWPSSMTLTCYLENMTLPAQDRVCYIDFSELGDDYIAFQSCDVKGRVHTFAKKAYSVIHAMNHSTADRIMWLDADVLTTKHITVKVLQSVMPDEVVSTHLGVRYTETKTGRKGDWLVPETGVFVLNTQHPQFSAFKDEYTRRYRERDFEGLRRSYDNDVYGAAVSKLNLPSLDLCQNLKKAYKTPLKHTVLGEYLHHYKAKHSKDYFVSAGEDQ